MPQSLAAIYIHLVFSTKNRAPVLMPAMLGDLHGYCAGTLAGLDCAPIQVGGVSDHIHALFRMNRTSPLANIVRDVKIATSKWIKENVRRPETREFHWQTGYGAFSVSHSNVPEVKKYILGQAEHHKHITFQDEMRRFLERHEIEYDERYVWD